MNYKDEIRSIVEREASFGSWKLPILFGILKKYRYYFWSYSEVRNINEKYHSDLEKCNGFPVPYLHFWRVRDKKVVEVNSFFIDIGKDPMYISQIICGVNYNLKTLYDLVIFWNTFNWDKTPKLIEKKNKNGQLTTRKQTKAEIFYEDAKNYLSSINGQIAFVPNKGNKSFFSSTTVWKNNSFGEKIIDESHKNTGGAPFTTPSNENFELEVLGSKLVVREANQIKLNDEAIYILRNWLDCLDDIGIDTARNLIENYKFYVDPNDYKKFERELRKNILILNSFYHQIAISKVIELVRKYYKYTYVLQIDVQKRDQQQQLTINDFKKEFHSNPVWMKAERLLYLVDVLGYFYNRKNKDKIRYFFLDRDGYIEINAVMRKFVKTSPGDWYCFDPKWSGEWYKQTYEGTQFSEMVCPIRYIIERHINITSGLVLDALRIAENTSDFKVAVKEINRAIRSHHKALKNGIKFF